MMLPQKKVLAHDSDQTPRAGQWLYRGLPLLLLLLQFGLLGGCVSLSPEHRVSVRPGLPPDSPPGEQASTGGSGDRNPHPTAVDTPAAPPPPQDLWARLRDDFRFQHIRHPRIAREIRRLQQHPKSFDALARRAVPYLYHIVDAVEQRDMPGELALLPAVESGYQPFAYSSNGAAGLWQFMPATGRMLGLEQNRLYDGRRDILRSTDAALDYLSQLSQQLDGNWLHALAAYNCGIGTVKKAIRKAERHARSTSYWGLGLPGETDAYVPRLLAFARIVQDPAKYGLALPALPNAPYFDTTLVDSALDLELAAELAGLPLDDLLSLNPGYRQGVTPARRPSRLLLPKAYRTIFEQALARLPKDKWVRWVEHRIRRGDTLIGIAKHYHVSVAAIREANGIKGHNIRAGKRLQIPLSGRASDRARRIAAVRSKVRYRVRKGDSLYTIARRFSVSIRDLKRWNRVGRYIRPGQHLTVYIRS